MSTEVDGRRQRSALSRASILDAAEQLFSTGGFHATSLRAIASTIGMSHAGVLKHFSSKGELLAAILQRHEAGNTLAALGIPEGLPPREFIRRLATHTMTQRVAVHLRVVLLGEATAVEHPAHAWVLDQLDRVETELGLALGVDGVDLLALWNGLQLISMYLPDIDPVAITYGTAERAPHDGPPAPVSAVAKRGPSPVHGSREREIVAAATEVFARGGYRSTGLREIAAELGLSHGTLLYHFPTKVDLLTAVLQERDRDESLPWTWDATPLDFLNGMHLQALHNEQHPGLAQLFSTLVCEATDPAHPAHAYFRSRYERFRSELRGVLAELVEDGTAVDIDPDLEAVALIALWDGLGLRTFYRDDPVGLPERLRLRINSLLTVKLSHRPITTP